MSLARRLFLARRPRHMRRAQALAGEPLPAPMAVLDPALLDWDDEARQTALDEARSLDEADPEGAAQLRAQVEASLRYEQERAGPILGRVEQYGKVGLQSSGNAPYDPVELYEFAMKYWRMSPTEIKRLDYREFFGYIRQAVLRIEAEEAESERIKKGYPTRAGTQPQAGMAGTAMTVQPYEGDVVPYEV